MAVGVSFGGFSFGVGVVCSAIDDNSGGSRGGSLYGKSGGEGKKDLLFLHGYLASGDSFAYQKGEFSKNFNVYAPDLKGFGKNADMEYPYSLGDYVRETKEYIQENGLKKPSVIAHSFGGRIALRLAAENPELLDKLVLTGCAGLKPRRNLKYFVKKAEFDILKRFFDREKLLAFYSEDYKKLSPVMRESFKKIVAERLEKYLPEIKNKTLIIFGKNDKETPPYMAKKLFKNIKNSQLIFIENAGHFAFIDKPFKFNTEAAEFLLSD